MLEEDWGSKSCSLVESIVNGVRRVNFSSILDFWEGVMTSDQEAHVFIICHDRERCVGDKSGRDSPLMRELPITCNDRIKTGEGRQ